MTTSSLFRQEALDHKKDRLFGDVILLHPLSMTVLVSVAVAICLIILSILFWGTYARKETVRGYLVPDKGIVKTYAPQHGTIARIHIKDGQVIKEGQTLITILSEHSLQGGSALETQVIAEIDKTRAQILDQIKGERSLSTSENQRYLMHIEALKKELQQVELSLVSQQDRLKISESRVKAADTLLKGNNLSQSDYQKLYVELLEQRQRYQDLLRAKGSTQSNLSQAQSELEQAPIKAQARIAELENRISELKQRAVEVQGRRTVEIRSPVDGIVTAIQCREGQWQATNTPLLAIMPQNAKFQVELLIPSRAIGFIKKDQVVRLRYDAFPYQRFGIYEGSVQVISKHVLLPSELPDPMVDLKEPVYRVTVDLKQQSVLAYGEHFPLQAGMMLDADIILDKQSLFERIFEPLISLKGRF